MPANGTLFGNKIFSDDQVKTRSLGEPYSNVPASLEKAEMGTEIDPLGEKRMGRHRRPCED